MTADRRIRRSREALHRALIALVLEKGYETVTIQDIVARADVGRSTFYAHFDSKEDLLTSGMAELRTLLLAHQEAALAGRGGLDARSLGFSRALFEHVPSYREVYRALVSERGSAIVLNRLRGLLADLVRRDLAAMAPPEEGGPVPRSALVHFVVGALIAMLTWWTERNCDLPPASVDAMFRRLTIPALAAALGTTPETGT